MLLDSLLDCKFLMEARMLASQLDLPMVEMKAAMKDY